MIVSISGIDGCGKTTVIEQLRKDLVERGQKPKVFWLRYNHYLTKLAMAIGRVTGLTVYELYDDCRVGYHEFYRSRLLAHLFIALTWLDALFTFLFLVYIPTGIFEKTVLCDRWVLDILIDLEIDTRLPVTRGGLYHSLFMMLLPAKTICLVIDRKYEVIKAARDEHKYDRNLGTRYELYQRLHKNPRYTSIDNTGSLEHTYNQIRQKVIN